MTRDKPPTWCLAARQCERGGISLAKKGQEYGACPYIVLMLGTFRNSELASKSPSFIGCASGFATNGWLFGRYPRHDRRDVNLYLSDRLLVRFKAFANCADHLEEPVEIQEVKRNIACQV